MDQNKIADDWQAAKDANEQINKICESAGLPKLTYDEQINWDNEPDSDPPFGYTVNGKRFGYWRHMVGGYKDSLEAAKQHVLTLLAPKVLSQMNGWFSGSDIGHLMSKKGEQAEYHRICNAARAILRGLDI